MSTLSKMVETFVSSFSRNQRRKEIKLQPLQSSISFIAARYFHFSIVDNHSSLKTKQSQSTVKNSPGTHLSIWPLLVRRASYTQCIERT